MTAVAVVTIFAAGFFTGLIFLAIVRGAAVSTHFDQGRATGRREGYDLCLKHFRELVNERRARKIA